MNLLKQVAAQLAFMGFGRLDGEIFWGRMPDAPDGCVGVFSLDSGVAGGSARVQVLIRDAGDGAAYEKACRIAQALDGFRGFLGGDGAEAKITVAGAAAGQGEDGRLRALYSVELDVMYGDEE